MPHSSPLSDSSTVDRLDRHRNRPYPHRHQQCRFAFYTNKTIQQATTSIQAVLGNCSEAIHLRGLVRGGSTVLYGILPCTIYLDYIVMPPYTTPRPSLLHDTILSAHVRFACWPDPFSWHERCRMEQTMADRIQIRVKSVAVINDGLPTIVFGLVVFHMPHGHDC